ncbi:hypothetical protein Athai_58920 [Actinocatenispora thailandica]|uniref:Uncharacterized protein n=1 Tax=Actinocatenispora thailandica TaxID=227318 RepID=A0A7R7I0C8_9ACTN|nr:hypothetical protein [Actinocatenispora thailandica]BCJ38389.1 hypothetical protein Athai_58920 [Actinocatenispora thailandica]
MSGRLALRLVCCLLPALLLAGCMIGIDREPHRGAASSHSASPTTAAPKSDGTTPPPSQAPVAPSPSVVPVPVPSTVPAAPEDPAAVVYAYFDAINNTDYWSAWQLGGKNLDSSYDHFAAGFDTTAMDVVTVQGVSGDVVSVSLSAYQTDGSVKEYAGTYTVRGGVIVAADVTEQ